MLRTCRCCGKQWESKKPQHKLLCGDSRKPEDVARLFDGAKANIAITSPPYASQRKYDESSGFRPIHPDAYVEWFKAVADAVASVLAPDGSYFLNVKEHVDDGERSLYVMDLVLAHKRLWNWRYRDTSASVQPLRGLSRNIARSLAQAGPFAWLENYACFLWLTDGHNKLR